MNSSVTAELTTEQLAVLRQLIAVGGGIGCIMQKASLNALQMAALPALIRAGYVAQTVNSFMVVLKPL